MGEIIPNIALFILNVIRFILAPIYALINFRKLPSIPTIKNPLLKLSATTIAMKIRNGELSSQLVVEAYIERIKEVNPFINAVVEDRFEAAINDAKICDARLKSGEVTLLKLETEKPLYGVPVTIKESCSLKGMSYTGGTISRKGMKAAEDGLAVGLLRNAGAIPLLVSNTSELCTSLHSSNFLFGSTMNPYDRRKTPGGSSGGEAALISAGASIFGIGSDFIGSIRIPAFFTGIFGHKPTSGTVPLIGHFPSWNNENFRKLLVLGPLARYVDDLYLAMKVLNSRSEQPLRLDESVDVGNLRVFYMDNMNKCSNTRSTSWDIRQTVHKAIQHLSAKGARVEELAQENIKDTFFILISRFVDLEMSNLLDFEHPESKNSFLEFIKSIVGLSDYTLAVVFIQLLRDTKGFISPSRREQYRKTSDELQKKMNTMLKDNGVLICPTYPCSAPLPQLIFFTLNCNSYCTLSNLLELPSTHVPMGLDAHGLPIGLQVISACHQDHICLAVAKELEKTFGGWIPPS